MRQMVLALFCLFCLVPVAGARERPQLRFGLEDNDAPVNRTVGRVPAVNVRRVHAPDRLTPVPSDEIQCQLSWTSKSNSSSQYESPDRGFNYTPRFKLMRVGTRVSGIAEYDASGKCGTVRMYKTSAVTGDWDNRNHIQLSIEGLYRIRGDYNPKTGIVTGFQMKNGRTFSMHVSGETAVLAGLPQ